MPRGRPPDPPHLRLIKGTARRSRAKPKQAAVDRAVMPTPPDFLSTEALAEWHDKCPLLFASGLVTLTNRAVLAAYCVCFARWKSAEEVLADMARDDQTGMAALTVRNAATGKTIENPMVRIANRAMADCVKFAGELGMTPSSRTRISADPPPSSADKYLT